jgi:AraC-like DNA-binding protein
MAEHFAMSEATMRRWLSRTGHGFAKILLHTRLEYGLSLLQTTDAPISQIALDCGLKPHRIFRTPSKKGLGLNQKTFM